MLHRISSERYNFLAKTGGTSKAFVARPVWPPPVGDGSWKITNHRFRRFDAARSRHYQRRSSPCCRRRYLPVAIRPTTAQQRHRPHVSILDNHGDRRCIVEIPAEVLFARSEVDAVWVERSRRDLRLRNSDRRPRRATYTLRPRRDSFLFSRADLAPSRWKHCHSRCQPEQLGREHQ